MWWRVSNEKWTWSEGDWHMRWKAIWDLWGGQREGRENMIDSMVTVREEMRIEWNSVSAQTLTTWCSTFFSHVNKGDGDFLQMKCPNRKDRMGGVLRVNMDEPSRKRVFFHSETCENIVNIAHPLPTDLHNLAAYVLMIFECLWVGASLGSLSEKKVLIVCICLMRTENSVWIRGAGKVQTDCCNVMNMFQRKGM